MKLKNATMAVCLSLCAAAAQAEVAVSASHHLVSAIDDAAGTQVSIDVTVRNDGESLSGLTLTARELFFADGEPQTLELGALASGESRVVRIETTSNYSATFFHEGQMFSLSGAATTDSGIAEITVTSDEENQ